MNEEETFDATEEFCNLTKNDDVSASSFEKRRARSLFSISSEQLSSGIASRKARPKFLLG